MFFGFVADDGERVPFEVVAQHGVEQADELSHAGDNHDFVELSGLFQSLGKRLDDGIEADGGEGELRLGLNVAFVSFATNNSYPSQVDDGR